jgi:crotonobetainyl-CoA:carnitine CoA-transferase CaiB-like acyl-CoA transferase
VAGALEGIRVLEFSQIIAGPYACQNLAEMGAEVIKVEPPDGEPWRQFSQFYPGEAKYFQSLNKAKQSLAIALQETEAQEFIHKLVPTCDVVLVNYRPDVAEKLRIDYPTLSAIKKDLIYADNTALGRRGPSGHRPGYDIVVQAMSGMMAGEGKVGDGGEPKLMSSTAVADYGTGLALAWGVTAALFHRERTGEGQMIEATLLQTAMAFQGASIFDLPLADEQSGAYVNRELVKELRARNASYQETLDARGGTIAKILGGVANIYYRPYQTKDGAVVVGALSASLFAKVRSALNTDFLGLADPELATADAAWIERAQSEVAKIEDYVRSKTTANWLEIFDIEGVPGGPVNFPEDMLTDPQVIANDMLVELDHELTGPQTQVGPIIKMSGTPLETAASPPLGRDNDRYARMVGFSEEEILSLREKGVIL